VAIVLIVLGIGMVQISDAKKYSIKKDAEPPVILSASPIMNTAIVSSRTV